MTPERVATALEEFIQATIAMNSSGRALARQRIAKQTFVNEFRLLLQVITQDPKGRRNERLDSLRREATNPTQGRPPRRGSGG